MLFKRKSPIQIHIATVFLALFLLLSGVSIWVNFSQLANMLRVNAQLQVEEASKDVKQSLTVVYRPVVSSVSILSNSALSEAKNYTERLAFLPLMASAAKLQGQVAAFQVGYADGDYFNVRYLKSADIAQRFNAPKAAHFMIDSIDHHALSSSKIRVFLDEQLNQIELRELPQPDYDPRTRPWFDLTAKGLHVSAPYLFYFFQKVGITVNQASASGGAVVAADVLLDDLSALLAARKITPSSQLVILDAQQQVVASSDERVFTLPPLTPLAEFNPHLARAFTEKVLTEGNTFNTHLNNARWLGANTRLPFRDYDLTLVAMYPEQEIFADAYRVVGRTILVNIFVLIGAIPLIWWVSRRLSIPIKTLAKEAQKIEQFHFNDPLTIKTEIKEIDELANSMRIMKQTVTQYNDMIVAMSGERHSGKVAQLVVESTRDISQANLAMLYLYDEDDNRLDFEYAEVMDNNQCFGLDDQNQAVSLASAQRIPEIQQCLSDKVVTHFNLSKAMRQQLQHYIHGVDEQTLVDARITAIPLVDKSDAVIGVLLLGYSAANSARSALQGYSWLGFVKALSGFAAVTLENRQLIQNQKALLESFIELIASAIDAKSPYTGGHCQRVPELTKLLAKAACEDTTTFNDFDLTEDQWEELHFAGWLHDCGKVTTPEFVVDKATKLETIYDRIHEVRTRFEVLKRDEWITYWQAVAQGQGQQAAEAHREAQLAQLDDDFDFIAQCNIGGEFMDDASIARLESIAKRTWQRTLCDRKGLSWEEAQRKAQQPKAELPVDEPLLADRVDHLIARDESENMPDDNPWGFKLSPPKYKYNRGELYNLRVRRGTLSDEERYKINDHMTQTIMMLSQLPYPKHLKNVPQIAGGHHETMDGKGYPKKLKKEDMPLTARMMAIADIFEALTAADRPYKKAKPLSEALKIMAFMRNDGHIDPELFTLFLDSGVYLAYAHQFISAAQIDKVTIADYK